MDADATLDGIAEAFKELAAQVHTHDVFVLYMAGHGVARDGTYYYLPYDFRYRGKESVAKQGVGQDHLQQWLASIQARKCVALLDTCHSGAFKGFERGLKEKTAIGRLVRATGRATIVASKADQPALEGYKGHGVFTHVLLQALGHADQEHGNRDGVTSVRELAAYVDQHVPKITFDAFGYEQIPQVRTEGRDFPLAVPQ